MALANSKTASGRLLPYGVDTALKGGLIRLTGGVMILFAIASWVCLLTWSFGDPSLNNATHRSVQNLLGLLGAAWADLVFQFVGLASIMLFLPLAAWGWHLARRSYPRAAGLRLLLWPAAILLLSFAFATSPAIANWPLPHGLGGIIGDYLLRQAGSMGSMLKTAAGILAFAAGMVLILFASAVRILALWELWKFDLSFIGHVFLLVIWPLVHWIADALASISLRRPGQRRLFEWRSILARMDADGGDDPWPAPPPPHMPPPHAGHGHTHTNPPAESGRIEPHFGHGGTTPYHAARQEPPAYAYSDEDDGWDGFEDDYANTPAYQPDLAPPHQGPSYSGSAFRLPHHRLLNKPSNRGRWANYAVEALQQNARALEGILQDFGVKGEIVRAHPGPVVTLYELEPARGVKSSRVIGLSDDIARSMSAVSARVAVIPGRNAIGIELPNAEREMVFLRELFETSAFTNAEAQLPLALGKDIGGDPVITDLTRMPHLLIAGTTGSGKSVGINTMIASLLYRLSPDQCKLILIDPKMLELSVYDGIPHLLTPVVTDPKKAIAALKWTIREMEERYKRMSKLGVRNINGFNERLGVVENQGRKLSRRVQTGFDRNTGRPVYETEEMTFDPMPFIVVVIDEMADLMMVAGKEIEAAVQRLAQMARAAGIHLITATQRPSVDVITGTIKANFPTRISFRVTSKVDSRTILGEQGAEQLLGDGDMLFMNGGGAITRVHGPFVSDDEIETLVTYLKTQGAPDYLDAVTEDFESGGDDGGGSVSGSGDELYDRAVAVVLRDRKASTSYIQRRLSVGYNKAASLIERMEDEGVIGPANHAGRRDILVDANGL